MQTRAANQDQDTPRAAEVLARTRAQVDPVLRAAVGTLPTRMRHIAGYHLGWWDVHGTPCHGGSGKALRPALVLAAARATGADGRAGRNRTGSNGTGPNGAGPTEAGLSGTEPHGAGLSAAAAVELVHNFTLLHDDVMDGDQLRRHRPTAWSAFGTPDAILAGDALQALALRLLARDAGREAQAAGARLAWCVIELCEGQHADCSFEERADVGMAECLAMAEAKTGSLLGCACALGALSAGADEEVVDAMDAFGRCLGIAFQLIDDLLGIWGDPRVTGKPAGSDLTALKKSLPVVAALASGTEAGRELADVYASGTPLSDVQLPHVADLVERAGGRAWAQGRADEFTRRARDGLAEAVPDPDAAGELLSLARLITRRDR
ncbi:polyprenyl synthetase [Streptomyces sp. CB02923]|uniref:family 2 encapsulin nanocompartment cargo protein polyprenyl transferase n=1 Tax=Streptomyces sp. CB02923 TaxID=1718985 RepID=UPI00093E3B60|nr:family 2 encapsulin nanocompartment cargo protein polyprenyl transferase [Streptomyces sp. CB02923]OKH98929.1 polyprenyl synthetase [Streptomyces sp. CB02923]